MCVILLASTGLSCLSGSRLAGSSFSWALSSRGNSVFQVSFSWLTSFQKALPGTLFLEVPTWAPSPVLKKGKQKETLQVSWEKWSITANFQPIPPKSILPPLPPCSFCFHLKKLVSLNQRGCVIINGVCRWKKFYVIHQLPVGHIEHISVNETMVPILRKKSLFIRVVSFLVLWILVGFFCFVLFLGNI